MPELNGSKPTLPPTTTPKPKGGFSLVDDVNNLGDQMMIGMKSHAAPAELPEDFVDRDFDGDHGTEEQRHGAPARRDEWQAAIPYHPNDPLYERIERDFRYHRATPEMVRLMKDLRDAARSLAHMIRLVVPEGREQEAALTRLEESIMHANAGISRQAPVSSD